MLYFSNPVGSFRIVIDVPYPERTFAITDEALDFLHCRLTSVNAII